MTTIAVCGGPYANPHALSAMIDDARERGCERIFCLGDMGGFGAECDAIWPLLQAHGVECIAGNYDVAIARGDEDCGCGYSDERDNRFAQILYDFTRANTSPAFAAWMGGLPAEVRETIAGVEVHMVHGSPLAVNDFMWESLPDAELRSRVEASGAALLLVTHTGLPWQRRIAGCLVVNVGAVGRPANDGSRCGWYATVELSDGEARADLVPVEYDWRSQAASMRAAGLPEPFVETVETGWWTTCLEVVPPAERARGRYQLYRDAVPAGFDSGAAGWAAAPRRDRGDRPVVPLFGSAAFPARLWVYSNFHCNLACDYCAVASSPRARPRAIGLARFRSLVDEAVGEGFEEIYVTGGEPFVEPEMVAMLEYASDRLPTVVLTNAMLFRGSRRAGLARLAQRPGLVLQTSLDGVKPETHDRFRGGGSWKRAIEGVELAVSYGVRVRAAMTETEANGGEVAALGDLLDEIGVEEFAVRPLVRRGSSSEGVEIEQATLVPELTITADGAHWHPVGADAETSPDLLLSAGEVPLAHAKRLVTERFLSLRQADGTLPAALHCAV